MTRTIWSTRQLGGPTVLRGVFRGFSEQARIRGSPSPSSGGFGPISVSSDPIIVAGEQIGSRPPMSALGGSRKQTSESV